MVESLSED
jgi:calmodulin